MTRDEKIAKARELRKAGESYPAIASRLGVASSTAQRWVKPECAEGSRAAARAWKARHPDEVSAYAKRYQALRPGKCAECGGPTSSKRTVRCRQCVRVAADEKARKVEAMWAAGRTAPEICAELGCSRNLLAMMMDYWRARGYNLPYRYRSGKRGGAKYPEQAAA